MFFFFLKSINISSLCRHWKATLLFHFLRKNTDYFSLMFFIQIRRFVWKDKYDFEHKKKKNVQVCLLRIVYSRIQGKTCWFSVVVYAQQKDIMFGFYAQNKKKIWMFGSTFMTFSPSVGDFRSFHLLIKHLTQTATIKNMRKKNWNRKVNKNCFTLA